MGNGVQSELWNGRLGEGWVSVESYIDRMLGGISAEGIAAAATQAGEKVLDIGCGCGTTSIELATSGASVVGVDIAAPMITQAANKDKQGFDVQFEVADAANADYTADHDCVFSRFGVMFFSDPVAAFGNIRSALKPSGRSFCTDCMTTLLKPACSRIPVV